MVVVTTTPRIWSKQLLNMLNELIFKNKSDKIFISNITYRYTCEGQFKNTAKKDILWIFNKFFPLIFKCMMPEFLLFWDQA